MRTVLIPNPYGLPAAIWITPMNSTQLGRVEEEVLAWRIQQLMRAIQDRLK